MSTVNDVIVSYGGDSKRYSRDFQTKEEFKKSWYAVLSRAHASVEAKVSCACKGKGQKSLAVKYHSGGDTYFLARYPNTGSQHSPDCIFFTLDKDNSGLKCYTQGVVKDLKDGGYGIRLDVALASSDSESTSIVPIDNRNKSGGVSQNSMSLLGLLQFLWDDSGLNRWYPKMAGKRNPGKVFNLITHSAEKIKVASHPLSMHLLAGAYPSTPQETKNIKMTSEALMNKERLICLNVLSKYNPERHSNASKRLPIKFFSGVPVVLMNTENWASLEKRFSSEIANWRSGGNVICMAIGDLGKFKGKDTYYLKPLQIALMNVDENWIPAYSSYELTMLNYLHKHERSFIKPLRYDASNNEVFPDFCLTDIGGHELFPIEVFGMDTASYLARKAIKESYYNERYGKDGWASWVAPAGPLPHLPDKGCS
ncbi:TPA: DUF1173 family protein [Klebsiella variicola subsp. variicola]|uniref:DUF1173 family protein n=1 Tax=Klebsiella pneumoniae TaxID=573 RepID=UPI00330D2751|nr:DUF1173 domain-containing protein [Klebsiella pneumoniae]HCM3147534.1 DUF1173 family protein [Klebsiella variicola subsp. variicola]HCB2895786.1 DUF1173 family protein [Klebsiella pneumoniae]HCB3617925.1 DUF1173 family protein [Klebsiella pneumoniae]HCM5525841.1 DUF1173 family protein [Klebsiella pneumoniae]